MTLEQKKSKKLFFLIALPRSGNTLLASILNQNPAIACTGNSITLEIMKKLYLLKGDETFQNFPDHRSLDNVLNAVFSQYYKHWPQHVIIDRGPVMTPGNIELMKKHFKPGFKCIVLLRDILDVLASYIKWYTENPDAFPNKKGFTDEAKLNYLLEEEGAIYKDTIAIQNSYNYPGTCHYLKYNDLVSQPETEIKKIYEFIEEPYYPHYFENLKQIKINDIGYDDRIVGKNMHTIKSVIKKENNPYVKKIPKSIIKKYENIRF
jgi:sulfotransferase